MTHTRTTKDQVAAGSGDNSGPDGNIWEQRYFGRLESSLDDIQTSMRDLRSEVHSEMHGLRVDVQSEIHGLRSEMRGQFRWMIGFFLTMMAGLATKILGH